MAEAAKAEVPPQPNPEAIEDKPAEPAAAAPAQTQFQNVDLEAGKPVTQTTTTTKVEKSSGIVAYADSWDYGTLNMVLAFASIVVMITSAIICGGGVTIPGYGLLTGMPCTGIQGWQIAVSVISAFVAILTVVAYVGGALPETAQTAISAFQFAWWTAGMIVLTFFGNYQTVIFANGYFATWLAYFASGLALVQASAHFRAAVDNAVTSIRSPFLALIVASAVVMGAAIGYCSPAANCVSYNAWALSLGTISLGFSLILFFVGPALPGNVLKAVAAFYVLWWAVGFCVVSFGGPFITPGNGYFASAAAVIASIALYRSAAIAAKTTSS